MKLLPSRLHPSIRGRWGALLLGGLLCVVVQGCARESDPAALKLMTFNIRYGTADDGDHAWPNRRDRVAAQIREEDPDVLAIQEALAFQLDELSDALTGYTKVGEHRDGGLEGEFSGLYVHDRVEVVDSGHFWLHPVEGSREAGWDAALPRTASWAEVRRAPDAPVLRVYGTHFDHRGEQARVGSARLMVRSAEGSAGAGSPPVVVMGDLNVSEDTEAFRTFVQLGLRSAVLDADPEVAVGTFNGFEDASGRDRIDHILVPESVDVLDARILDGRVDGLFPSDHYAVVARVRVGGG